MSMVIAIRDGKRRRLARPLTRREILGRACAHSRDEGHGVEVRGAEFAAWVRCLDCGWGYEQTGLGAEE